MLLENMSMAIHAIKANKMRSFLTMLGIIIGIGSVIAIVSIGDSMRYMISNIYKNVGTNMASVYIWPADGSEMRQSDYFTLDELDRIHEVFGDEISYIDSDASVTTEALFGRNKVKYMLEGIKSNFPQVYKIHLIYGRNLNRADVKGRKKNVVLEAEGAKALFGTENAIGKVFRTTINGETDDYHVVGVYRLEMSPLQKMLSINKRYEEGYISNSILTLPEEPFFDFRIYGKKEINMKLLSSQLTDYLARTKHRTKADINFDSMEKEQGQVDNVMGKLSLAVGGIAAISLLVGGIGIMNIMLVSVTERTREIGIRKSLGAKTNDILIQFLTESAILSAIGGILGITIGAGLVYLGGAMLSLSVVVRPTVVILAVGFSALVGAFFGIYPASKAAKADPIDALRYE
jgi:putative ABC transport system permease protein